MSSSQLPDQQEIFELETLPWYNRIGLLIIVGIVFICIPFMIAYSTVRNKFQL
jgi:hypothetical protein